MSRVSSDVRQRLAALILSGFGADDIAKEVGVDRKTVHRHIAMHEAELSARQRGLLFGRAPAQATARHDPIAVMATPVPARRTPNASKRLLG